MSQSDVTMMNTVPLSQKNPYQPHNPSLRKLCPHCLRKLQLLYPLTQVTVLKCMNGQHQIKIMNQVPGALPANGTRKLWLFKAKSTFGVTCATVKIPIIGETEVD